MQCSPLCSRILLSGTPGIRKGSCSTQLKYVTNTFLAARYCRCHVLSHNERRLCQRNYCGLLSKRFIRPQSIFLLRIGHDVFYFSFPQFIPGFKLQCRKNMCSLTFRCTTADSILTEMLISLTLSRSKFELMDSAIRRLLEGGSPRTASATSKFSSLGCSTVSSFSLIGMSYILRTELIPPRSLSYSSCEARLSTNLDAECTS